MSVLDQVYARSPVWLQHGMVSAYGLRWRRLRLGGEWPAFTEAFRSREGWREPQWRAFTATRLREILLTAFDRVPHYRDEWRRLGVTRGRLAAMDPEQLGELPILTKDVVRRAPKALLIDGVAPRGIHVFHTSGSTGTPIATYWTTRELQRSLAMREARSAGWAGVTYLESRATFSGRLAVPDSTSLGPYHRYNVFERQVYFSPFHLGPETATQYLAALDYYRPQWLTGYAYSYYTLARLAKEQGLSCAPPQAIVTTSEKVTAAMRPVMEEVFGCKVYEEYGTVEDVMYACECEEGGLHVNPDAGIVEILDEHGQPCPPGVVGQVVATGFVRDQQIFVRFALGDEAAWAGRSCPCGREMPLLQEVTGRIEDAIVGPDGREMVRFHGIFVDQPHVVEGQIVQETLRDITVLVVAAPGFGRRDIDEITRRIRTRLTADVRVAVSPVDAIPRTKAGKYQAVVSKVSATPRPSGPT